MTLQKSWLVTGAAGFIGSNFIRWLLSHSMSKPRVIAYDLLTYAGDLSNLDGLVEDYPDQFEFRHADIRNAKAVEHSIAKGKVDTIVHFAAESHVDKSISGPMGFVTTNVEGTAVLLEAARKAWGKRQDVRFHHVSTDEVYGSLGPDGAFTEATPYDPSSPYSASKAASDHLVRAWHRTYGLPVSISNCSNNYGPRQNEEKLIPTIIHRAIRGEKIPVYGDGKNVRDWLHVDDHVRAILAIIGRGQSGRTYNVGARCEHRNIDLVRTICEILDDLHELPDGAPHESLIEFVADRPGHDRRYAIDPTSIELALGWHARESLADGLRQTVKWYLDRIS